ncbi:hypothetical protein EKO04_003794 [Ascochyta lentis]|uniref:Uncharacterized protein n=1 Tax=Ascochyta lentis TaxID=205686 RepID=A0A8H7J8Y4_9PLEO|nr:hypothetical protein EKO04_003794 [Ascochyta lentis]
MATYSYIPPEYKTSPKMPLPPSSIPLPQLSPIIEPQKPHMPHSDAGATGKYLPLGAFKPLPRFSFEKLEAAETESVDDEDCSSMTTHVGENDAREEVKQEGRIAKAVKEFSKKLVAAVSKK